MQTFSSGGTSIRLRQSEPTSATACPAVLLLHGAGGNVNLWFERLAPMFAKAGIAFYAPHYFDRTGTQFADTGTILDGEHVPLWLATAGDALTYISKRPCVDPSRIALLGISLGAFISLALGTDAELPRIRAIVELSGGLASPWDTRVTPDFPPTLIIHGEKDKVVAAAQARKVDRILTSQNVPHQTELFPAEDHMFSAAAREPILTLISTFLEKYL